VYAGVVGAEMGTPDVGKRLLVEDIEVRNGEGKGATRGRERDGCQLTCCTCTKRKGKGNKFTQSRANLPFQDASGRDHVADSATSIVLYNTGHPTSNDNWFHTTNKNIIGGITLEEINIL